MSLEKYTINHTLLVLATGDLAEQDTQAVVNAANSSLSGGGGVDGALHRAGGLQILAECAAIIRKRGSLRPGEAVLTGGGNLAARYVIHTVGPVWQGGDCHEDETLRNAYHNSLALAREKNISSLSFPSISTGAYRFPLERAARIALSEIFGYIDSCQCFTEVRVILWKEYDFHVYHSCLEELLKTTLYGKRTAL